MHTWLRALHALAFAFLVAFECDLAGAADYRPPRKNLGFPVYTNQPPGRQVSGQHAPATTPALSPAEAQQRFTLPPGFEIRLFASEPEVVNPVAMTWDERGRLWVVELYEYPLGASDGEKPRDRIKILEDTDADGLADKVHVWADGLNLATGLLLGNGGAYVGQAPHLLFLRDTDGDDRADTTEIVRTGFGLEDRHELLNGFTWGPDGYLYMTHGVFTRSSVQDPALPGAEPVLLTAGVARLHVAEPRRFEVFAEGTSNPWGVDFDRYGNAFVSACVIEHLFHLAPGGIYDRQAGTEPHSHAYERLHAINDHRHHMAAYAGIQVYQGNQFPTENAGTILQGNIHDNAVHQDRLRPNGSSFTASAWRDLVRANDGWFMPVSTQVGPDGAIWIMDWYDRYPCYQNANADPGGVDREHGRIWRVVHTGNEPGKPVPSRPQVNMALDKLPSADLVELLAHPNVWQRRMAQRLLNERRDNTVLGKLQALFRNSGAGAEGATAVDTRLAALWTLHSSGYLNDDILPQAARDPEPGIRLWAARLIGERQVGSEAELEILRNLAADSDPAVRLAVAVACRQFTSGHLTVNRPPQRSDVNVSGVLARLTESSARGDDPVLPFMIWHAVEPLVASAPKGATDWFVENGPRHMPLTAELARKTVRRLCDLGGVEPIDHVVSLIQRVLPSSPPLAKAALEGLIQGQEARPLKPSVAPGPWIATLTSHQDPAVRILGQRLGVRWGDPNALTLTLRTATDSAAPTLERIAAIKAVRQDRSEATRETLVTLLSPATPEMVQSEAIAALGEIGGDNIATVILGRWKDLSPACRRTAASTLASRRTWALPLLEQVRAGTISPSDFGAPVLRNLVRHRDDVVRDAARAAIGRFRESPEDKARLVAEKRRIALAGVPDLEKGREVTAKTCLVCHKFLGQGAEVGPDLTGVGRSSLDALLWNIIDPNQVVGAGYEQVEIETHDDRVIAGRLVEDTDQRTRLLLQGPKEEVVAKEAIRSRRTLESSVMPEGLEQLPDDQWRDMIWFILAPPEEGALTPSKRSMLTGEPRGTGTSAGAAVRVDGESVALWNPEWRVRAPDFEGSPARLPEYHERSNVLMTHPFNADRPAVLERTLTVPAGAPAMLRFAVAAHDQGDWELRVVSGSDELLRTRVTQHSPRWKGIELPLEAGKTHHLRLENHANDWAWEFGYWADLTVVMPEPLRAAVPPGSMP